MKVLRIGTVSQYETSRGLRAMSQQKTSVAVDRLVESPLAMLFAVAQKLSHKQACLEGSTTYMEFSWMQIVPVSKQLSIC